MEILFTHLFPNALTKNGETLRVNVEKKIGTEWYDCMTDMSGKDVGVFRHFMLKMNALIMEPVLRITIHYHFLQHICHWDKRKWNLKSVHAQFDYNGVTKCVISMTLSRNRTGRVMLWMKELVIVTWNVPQCGFILTWMSWHKMAWLQKWTLLLLILMAVSAFHQIFLYKSVYSHHDMELSTNASKIFKKKWTCYDHRQCRLKSDGPIVWCVEIQHSL